MYSWTDCTLNNDLFLLFVIWIVSLLYTDMFKLIYQLGSMFTLYLFLSVFDNSKGFLDRHIILVQNLILLSLYILFYIYLYSITIKCMVEDLIYCFQMWKKKNSEDSFDTHFLFKWLFLFLRLPEIIVRPIFNLYCNYILKKCLSHYNVFYSMNNEYIL